MGILDGPVKAALKAVTNLFTNEKVKFTKVVDDHYQEDAGVDNPTKKTAEVLVTPPAEIDAREVDGGSVQRGDVRFIVSAVDLDAVGYGEPEPGDIVEIDGVVSRVVNVRKIKPGDSMAGYAVSIRGPVTEVG